MEFHHILLEKRERIATLTLNRPQVLNALNIPLLQELKVALEELERDEGTDVVILTGAGRAFTAGMDLKAIGQPPPPGEPDPLIVALDTFDTLENLTRPVIGAINGFAITGGLELALICDILIASEKAVFADTHAQVGVVPGGGNTQRLPRILGLSKAKQILFASDFISAQEAYRLGMVAQVVPEKELQETCMALARKIAANDQRTVRKMKWLINQGRKLNLGGGLTLERAEFLRFCQSRQPREVEQRRTGVMERGREETRRVSGATQD